MGQNDSPTGVAQGADRGVAGSSSDPAGGTPMAAYDPFAALNVSPEREARIREVARELGVVRQSRVVEAPARPSSPLVRAVAFLGPVIVVGLILYRFSDQWGSPPHPPASPATGVQPPTEWATPVSGGPESSSATPMPEVTSVAPPAEPTLRPIPPFAFSPPAPATPTPPAPATPTPPAASTARTSEGAYRPFTSERALPPPSAPVEESLPQALPWATEVRARPEAGPASPRVAAQPERPPPAPSAPRGGAPSAPASPPPSQPQPQQPAAPVASQRSAYPQYPPPYGWAPQPYPYGYPSSAQSR